MIVTPTQIPRTQIKECLEETLLSVQEKTVTEIALTSLALVALIAVSVFSTTLVGFAIGTGIPQIVLRNSSPLLFHPHMFFRGIANVFWGSLFIKIAIFTATIAINTLNPAAGLIALGCFAVAGGYAFPFAKAHLLPVLIPFLKTKEQENEIITSLMHDVRSVEHYNEIVTVQNEIATKRTLSTLTTKMIQSLMQKAPHVYTEDFVRLQLSPSRFSKLENLPPPADNVEEQPEIVTIHPYQKVFHHAIFLLSFSLFVALNPIPTIAGVACMIFLQQDVTFRQWAQNQEATLDPEQRAIWTQIQPIDTTLQKVFFRTTVATAATGVAFILLGSIGAGLATSYFISSTITVYTKPHLPTCDILGPSYSFMEAPIGSHFT